ncbi:MAG: purine-nucleoside phosphorylase [Clostridia bacterium]|nr:purine-nucleoside phosphorylase [Candidatus Pelethousia sp.]NCB30671.1 purine-nucleoside phosphorylase [Clostridia bacterium]
MFTISQYRESADYIQKKLGGFSPEVLLILGSGLGGLAEQMQTPVYIPYGEIPHFKKSTAMGHAGRFVAGLLGGKRVLMMQGRLHVYEGHTMEEVAYPVRVARLLGIETLIVTNAAGGVNLDLTGGKLMLIRDYIKFTLDNPLMGPNLEEFGPRFPDMTYVFDQALREKFKRVAAAHGETVAEGVYFYMTGPQYETPAEIRAIRALGGDAVGMSTVPEAIAANHCGMRILGVSLVTNMAAGVLDQPLSGDDVIQAANAAGARFQKLMRAFLEAL